MSGKHFNNDNLVVGYVGQLFFGTSVHVHIYQSLYITIFNTLDTKFTQRLKQAIFSSKSRLI